MMNADIANEAARIAALPEIARKGGLPYLRGLVRQVGRAMLLGQGAGAATYEVLCSAGYEDGGVPNGLGALVMRSAEVACYRAGIRESASIAAAL